MRLARTAGSIAAFLLLAPAALSAQANGCTTRGPAGSIVETSQVSQLPVDRISDLLALEPGVVSLDRGDLSVRGSGTGAVANYLDGIPVTPGHRGGSALLGGSYYGELGTGIAVGTNEFDRFLLFRGLGPAELGNGRGGALAVSTDGDCRLRNTLAGGLASDAVLGKKNGIGFNRFTLSGNRQAGKFSFGGDAVFEGLSSERLGLEQNQSPVFVTSGIDTSVTFDPGGGPVAVNIPRFKESDGIRIPSSASSSYTLGAHLGYEVAPGQEFQLAGYASQQQDRAFDYLNLYNPRQLGATRAWSRVVRGSWLGRLKSGDALSLRGEAHLSWQTDRLIGGPLSTSSEQDSRDPFGGFLVSPLGFRFDFDNFAVNDELVRNIRTDTGRRSPYDLDNTSQYSLIDRYRNNAYGLTGFSESGGPVGQLTLSRENRLVGKGVIDATIQQGHRLRLGFEHTRYDIDLYQSGLTTQAQANAYIESPSATGIFGDYRLSLGEVEVNAGVRYDRFKSGASRPDFPRLSSAPGFNPANPTAGFIADKSHTRVSPRIQAEYQATPKLRLRTGFGTLAQQPDFAAVLAGINTDLNTTNLAQVYGTDLDFEHSRIVEVGATLELRPGLTAAGNVWNRKDEDLPVVRLVSEFDPLKGFAQDIRRVRNDGTTKATGLDLQLRQQLGRQGQAWLGYTYTDASQEASGFSPFGSTVNIAVADSRPHSLAGAVLYQTGPTSRLLGGALRNTGVYGALRFAGGTAYTRCPPFDPNDTGVLSGEPCVGGIDGDFNGSRLPALKLVDLRLTREIALGGTRLVAFVDARNLLNSRNVIRVFTATGTTSNTAERDRERGAALNEFSGEGDANGALQPGGTIDLSFGGAADPRAACGSWTTAAGASAVPNCIYLIGAEARWGNGDHLFTAAEQTRASDALYQVARGLQNFTGPGRRVRIGLELRL